MLKDLAGCRVLLLNWRDRSHPLAGGAEVYCEEIGQRFAAAGAAVTLLTTRYSGAAGRERRRGIDILRRGSKYSIYVEAVKHLLLGRNDYDVVVDFQNGIPFFSPLFVPRRTAVVLVVHHVHQDQFALHFSRPLRTLGRFLEGPVSRWVYGRRPVVTVSPSTRREVRKRLRLRGPAYIVPNGVSGIPDALSEGEPASPLPRSAHPRIAVVSRLVAHKRLHLLIEALPGLRRTWPGLHVDIAGDGPARPSLEERARAVGADAYVTFHGFVPEAERLSLLGRAWLTVCPSQAEGWGLTVLEANSVGVPAVAFKVVGLRDAIVNGVTGWLVPPDGTLEDTIDRALRRLEEPEVAESISHACLGWSASFSWDATAERLAGILAAEVARLRNPAARGRAVSDVAVRVELGLDMASEVADRIPRVLRRTDLWWRRDDRVSLLLMGCDESGAERALDRIGAVQVLDVAVADGGDLLVGCGP
ncbi:glycosyltransferase family 4 protein [Blastococcus sp. SYSU DS0973]